MFKSNFFKNKNIWIYPLIIFYFILVVQQIQKLFVADEVPFIEAAHGVATTGVPSYVGEGGSRYLGLWHPTLFINTLALSFKILGTSEWSARIVPVLFTLCTLVIVYLLAKEVSNNNSYIIFLSCFLFLSNPFVIQSSLLIDIDNSVLTFLIALFVYTYLKIDKTKVKNLVLLGVLFGVALWAKFGTPPILILAILIFHFLKRDIKTGIFRCVTIGFIGTLLFLSTWLLYSNIFNLPYLQPFIHNIGYISPSAIQDKMHFLLTHLWGLKNIVFWATPFYILLILIVFVKRVQYYFKNKNLNSIDYLLLNGLLIFIEYLIVGSSQTQDFPRYFTPMMPIFSVIFADYICQFKPHIKKNIVPVIVFVIIILTPYYIFILKDPLLVDRIIFDSTSISEIIWTTLFVSILYILPVVISFIFFKIFNKENNKHAIVLAIILSLVTFSVYMDIIQSNAEYNTGYFYGESGMKETINYVNSKISPNDSVIAEDAMAYYLNVKKYYYLPTNLEKFEEISKDENIKYIIIVKKGYYTTPRYSKVLSFLNSKYELDAQFGDFKIYHKDI